MKNTKAKVVTVDGKEGLYLFNYERRQHYLVKLGRLTMFSVASKKTAKKLADTFNRGKLSMKNWRL